MKILLASLNKGKQKEMTHALRDVCEVVLPQDIGLAEIDVVEDGQTLTENAHKKARELSLLSHLPSLGDDTGLCVDALGGAPGIASKRWVAGSDADRNVALLAKLQDKTDRAATFVCVLALCDAAGRELKRFTGECRGRIALSPSGSHGFGYDSVFIPDGYDQTFAELGAEVKDKMSHRARALQQMVGWLKMQKK